MSRSLCSFLIALLSSQPAFSAGSCEDVISKELTVLDGGRFNRPSVRKEPLLRDSKKYYADMDKLAKRFRELTNEKQQEIAYIVGSLKAQPSQNNEVKKEIAEKEKLLIYPGLMSKMIANTPKGKQLLKLQMLVQKDFKPSESTDHLKREGMDFDNVIEFGPVRDPILTVYKRGDEIIAYTSEKQKGGPELVVVSQLDCKIDRLVKFATEQNYAYLTAKLCADLPSQKTLAMSLDPNDNSAKTANKSFGQNCNESGGKATGIDGNSGGCKCPDERFVNPFFEMCAQGQRKSDPKTDQFEKFVRARGGLIDFNKRGFEQAMSVCSYHKSDFVPTDRSGAFPGVQKTGVTR